MTKDPEVVSAIIAACSGIIVALISGVFLLISIRSKSAENPLAPERTRLTNVRENILPSKPLARKNLLGDLADVMPISISRPDTPLGSIMSAFGGFIVAIGVLSPFSFLASASWIGCAVVAMYFVGFGYFLISKGIRYHSAQIGIGKRNGDIIIALQRRLLQEPGFEEHLFTAEKIERERKM